MFVIDMLFALVIALVLTGIFGLGFGRYGMGTTLAVFFIIVFFATWAGGVWSHALRTDDIQHYHGPRFS